MDALCQVWLKLALWFLIKRWKYEKIYRRMNRRTDRQQGIRKAHLSFQLRWAKIPIIRKALLNFDSELWAEMSKTVFVYLPLPFWKIHVSIIVLLLAWKKNKLHDFFILLSTSINLHSASKLETLYTIEQQNLEIL